MVLISMFQCRCLIERTSMHPELRPSTDLFRYVTQQPNLQSGSFLGDGTQFADLRGLGFDTTLVLINGRRTFASASAVSVNAFDLNSIPLGAVESIEIVSDSTSAISRRRCDRR
jgi:iron complex outermembrane receptor protein